tara:strand:- start:166 stop:438 length:273 start_codon:yes stop_codon:yes gene_type:complete
MIKVIKNWMEVLVKDRRLSPKERIAIRLGYMGTGFIMLAPYILSAGNIGPVVYIMGGVLSIPQVWLAKQWNLVAVNVNVMIGYTIYLYNV